MSAPIRRRRPESTASIEAARLKAKSQRTTITRRKMREVPGAIVAHINIPYDGGGDLSQGHHSLTAAAKIVHGGNVASSSKAQFKKQAWQKDSWELRSQVGEFRFAGDRIARAVSQVKFFGAKVDDPLAEPDALTEGPAFELSNGMLGDKARTQQSVKRAAQQLSFSGESLLVVSQDDNGRHHLDPMSTTELTGAGKTWTVNDGIEPRKLTDDELVIRCWTPDPEQSALPDCPARAVLSNARTLRELSKHTSAQVESRLAGAGMLLLPKEIEIAAGQGDPERGDEDDDEIDPFVADLMDMMMTALSDPDSAAALVPLIAKVPAEYVDKIKHLTFATPLDPQASNLRAEEIRRIALGMDSPPEVLLGMGSSNHWSAWAVGEDEVTLAVIPTAATIAHALTIGWYQPALQQLGVPDWDRHQIWIDASALKLRPDRSKDAQALYEKKELSAKSMRAENGFDEDDAPEDEERINRELWALVSAQPQLGPALIPYLVPGLPQEVLDALSGIVPDDTPEEVNDTPSDAAPTDEQHSLPTRGDTAPAQGDAGTGEETL
ncbi:hypothetical protein [Rhodococcoides kyotonense]|uniref:Uncharacterized protein n=1 Tax=Rhodococcoides kyotonense TaxID=398843 RepID=A0A239FQF7_9NOCA|nr:hypothetical protein [Rhodococcus kyotonensis]SNS58878.1 hypothetical protein SAMN05421642_103401 [Rhodococcus kyotonensis]